MIQFPTQELADVPGSIGITQPPEKVYIKGYSDIKVQLHNGEGKVADALVRLFRDDNSLRMVNEVAKAVFHSDFRVYEWVEKNLRDDRYKSVEDVLRDAVDYGKYLKDISHKQKPYSQTYLKTLHNQLSAIFNHAVRYYELRSNPAAKVGNMGSEEHKEMLFWTKEEYKKFSYEMMDKPVSFYAFEMLYWCGIREGELLALTAADFNFDKETVTINK